MAPAAPLRRSRTRSLELLDTLSARIREGRYSAGERLPTEAGIVGEFGVSRTVVREAISRLQAAGMVETRHGIGTFVIGLGDSTGFRVSPEQMSTLQDVIAVLELRIGIETEAAALAAQRRTEPDIERLRDAVAAFDAAVQAGQDSVAADFQFHQAVSLATQNPRFADMLAALGVGAIPRSRLRPGDDRGADYVAYLKRVNLEHESIAEAIAVGDAEAARAAMRMHLANSRERRRRAAAGAQSL